MVSKWSEYKSQALALRKAGYSLGYIEKLLSIPRSTLSGWCKDVTLSDDQSQKLRQNSIEGLAVARKKASQWHRSQKTIRLTESCTEAQKIVDQLPTNPEILDLALAMLYLGEGRKTNTTSIASSDPKIIQFALSVLKSNYGLSAEQVKCELRLRMDQNPEEIKIYWSKKLGVPLHNFGHVAFDQRTSGKKTYPHYKGVCVLQCGKIAIQRKLVNIYNLFVEKVIGINDVGV